MLLVTGCASKGPAQYDPEKSRALNLVNATGIESTLKDTEVPKDTVNTLMKSGAADAAFAVSGFGAPLPGLGGLQTAGLNLLSTMFGPEDTAARNSIFAWMPDDIAGNKPNNSFRDILASALSQSLDDLGYEYRMVIPDHIANVGFAVFDSSRDCNKLEELSSLKEGCYIKIEVISHKEGSAPDFVASNGSDKSYIFEGYSINHTRILFKYGEEKLNQFEILQGMSKHMPKWAFMYLAPGKTRIEGEKKLQIPVVLDQGKTLYFVKEENLNKSPDFK